MNYIQGDTFELTKVKFTDDDITLVGGSDRTFRAEDFANHRGKFYIQNLDSPVNDRLRILPIGLEDLSKASAALPHWGVLRGSTNSRNEKVLIGPFGGTNPIRQEVIASFRSTTGPWTVLDRRLSPFAISKQMRRHQYVLCPPGNGLDTHRYWEAFYWGAVPIVLKSIFSSNLLKSGLPHLSVDSFTPAEVLRVLEVPSPKFKVDGSVLDVSWWSSELGIRGGENGIDNS